MGERHVIKGRGENRGKYLCYARHAGLPPDSGFVWLPEQRKAMRLKDPRYSGETYEIIQARKHNGYFVRLTCPKSLNVDDLRAFIRAHAAGASERLPCHWFGADFHNAGENFCRPCAEKLVDAKYAADPARFAELYGDEHEDAEDRYRDAIDGGWRIEHDSIPFCETCGAHLDGALTNYGVGEEIAHFAEYGGPSFDDSEGWEDLDNALIDVADDDPRWRKIARAVEAARKEGAEAMPGARVTLLGVLASRVNGEAASG